MAYNRNLDNWVEHTPKYPDFYPRTVGQYRTLYKEYFGKDAPSAHVPGIHQYTKDKSLPPPDELYDLGVAKFVNKGPDGGATPAQDDPGDLLGALGLDLSSSSSDASGLGSSVSDEPDDSKSDDEEDLDENDDPHRAKTEESRSAVFQATSPSTRKSGVRVALWYLLAPLVCVIVIVFSYLVLTSYKQPATGSRNTVPSLTATQTSPTVISTSLPIVQTHVAQATATALASTP